MNDINNFTDNSTKKKYLYRMLGCLTKYYFYKCNYDDDCNLENWIFIGPFSSLNIAEKILIKLKNYNKEFRSSGLSSKIVKKSGINNKYFNTYHVAYNASLSKNKLNKTLKTCTNPNEWIFDFLDTLKPKYNGSDFSSNLPFMPNILERDKEERKILVINKLTISKIFLNIKPTKQKLTKEEVLEKIKQKKELAKIKENENKLFLERKKLEMKNLKTNKQLNLEKLQELENNKLIKNKEVVSKFIKVDKNDDDFLSIYNNIHDDEY
jgi:hypothetical protein